MPLHVRPLTLQNAVDDRVAGRAVAAGPVVADDAVLLRPERLDRALRAEVEIVGAETDDGTAENFERVRHQQQLARRVHAAALATGGVPGVADLDAVDGRVDV